MKTKRLLSVFLLLLLMALASGCGQTDSGGFGGGTPPPAGSSTVSVVITDTPPAGVTVISFEVTITGATLNPSGGGTPVNLMPGSTPIQIEVKQLEVKSAFLSAASVPAGTYSGLTVTFQNAEIAFKNGTAGNIGSCGPGQVCEIQVNTSGSFTYSGAPFPVTIVANTPTGFLVDVNLNSIITGTMGVDFTTVGAFTVAQLPLPGQPTGQLEEIEDVVGTVANKFTNQFTLQTAQGNLTVNVDNSTQFEDFEEATPPCTANPQNIGCVQNGQIVEVDLRLMTAGTLLARKIELEDDANQEEVEGVVVSIGPGATPVQFQMVVVEEIPNISGLDVGNLITVNTLAGAQFRVDNDGLTVPPGLQFGSGADLLVGQQVQVRRQAGSSGTTVNTDRVRLRRSRFTARVKSKTGNNFNLDSLPGLFASATPAITEIRVITSATETNFENAPSGLGSINVNDNVSVRGLLFKTASGIPDCVAKKVRKR